MTILEYERIIRDKNKEIERLNGLVEAYKDFAEFAEECLEDNLVTEMENYND